MTTFSEKLFLSRSREKLSATLDATRHASTTGTGHVLQRADGSVMSSRTGYFTFDLGEAHGVSPESLGLLGAKVVPTGVAREMILEKLGDATAEIEASLSKA